MSGASDDWFERVCGSVVLRCDCTLGAAEIISAGTGEVLATFPGLGEVREGLDFWSGRDDDMAAALGIAIDALES